MNIIVIGHNGQLAWELAQLSNENTVITCLGRNQIDINNEQSISEKLLAHQADAVINASAYTAVDQAETDETDEKMLTKPMQQP